MQSIKLQIQRQSFIQNILDPKPNFELLLISNYCNSLKIEAHKTEIYHPTQQWLKTHLHYPPLGALLSPRGGVNR